jgi:tetratricopeptide (TPR) repeat protein
MKQYKEALETLSTVPLSSLTLKNLLNLANLTRDLEGKRKAKSLYMEVLSRQPFAIEALLEVMDGTTTEKEFQSLGKGKLGKMKWLTTFFEGFQLQSKFKYSEALEKFSQVDKLFPNNLQVLRAQAICYYKYGERRQAFEIFAKIHDMDSKYVDSMDIYAFLIREKGDLSALNKLAHDLLEANPYRAETWTVIAIYCDAKHRKEKALVHLERALNIDPRCAMAHYYKGYIYMYSLDKFEKASKSFQRARSIQPDLLIYKGLIESLLVRGDILTASRFAKEIQKMLPNNGRARSLLALVYAHSSEKRYNELAKKIFTTILRSDSNCIDAVLGIAKLHVFQENEGEAVKLLK